MKSRICLAVVGAVMAAGPSLAQEFYLGGSLGIGSADTTTTYSFSGSSDTNLLALFAGARVNMNGDQPGGLYFGAEVEAFRSTGFGSGLYNEEMDDAISGIQGELHLGYAVQNMRFYGFVGRGTANIDGPWVTDDSPSTRIYGLGTEFDVGQKLAIRVEHAISKMHVDACSSYDVKRRDTSVGLVFKF